MSWNYRIIKHPGPDDTEWWGIHEVYYDGHGNIESYTERPDVVGHGLDDLLGTITLLAGAVTAAAKGVASRSRLGSGRRNDEQPILPFVLVGRRVHAA